MDTVLLLCWLCSNIALTFPAASDLVAAIFYSLIVCAHKHFLWGLNTLVTAAALLSSFTKFSSVSFDFVCVSHILPITVCARMSSPQLHPVAATPMVPFSSFAITIWQFLLLANIPKKHSRIWENAETAAVTFTTACRHIIGQLHLVASVLNSLSTFYWRMWVCVFVSWGRKDCRHRLTDGTHESGSFWQWTAAVSTSSLSGRSPPCAWLICLFPMRIRFTFAFLLFNLQITREGESEDADTTNAVVKKTMCKWMLLLLGGH